MIQFNMVPVEPRSPKGLLHARDDVSVSAADVFPFLFSPASGMQRPVLSVRRATLSHPLLLLTRAPLRAVTAE